MGFGDGIWFVLSRLGIVGHIVGSERWYMPYICWVGVGLGSWMLDIYGC